MPCDCDSTQPQSTEQPQDTGQSDGAGPTRVRYTTLFRIMFWVVIAAFAVFLVFSYFHLDNILSNINQPSSSAITPLLQATYPHHNDDQYRFFLTQVEASLESDVIANRHKRAATALNARTWMRSMSLAFGAVLSIVGSAFVLGGVSIPRTDGRLRWGDIRIELVSHSPGLFILVLGVALILAPHFSRQSISIDETSIFLGSGTLITDPSDMNSGDNTETEVPNEDTGTIDVEHLMPASRC